MAMSNTKNSLSVVACMLDVHFDCFRARSFYPDAPSAPDFGCFTPRSFTRMRPPLRTRFRLLHINKCLPGCALTQSHPVLPSLIQSHPVSPSLAQSHPVWPSLFQSHPVSPSLTQSHAVSPDRQTDRQTDKQTNGQTNG